LQVSGLLHLLRLLPCAHYFGLRKKKYRQDRTGSCRVRLSSKRDSKCFTNDKNASSRTTLNYGRYMHQWLYGLYVPVAEYTIADSVRLTKLLSDKSPPRAGCNAQF
jgi:hypothetical protein